MKRILILTSALALAMATSFAAITSLTLDYSTTTPGFSANASYGAFNWTTGHWVSCDYGTAANWQIRVVDGADGSLTGDTLAKGTINSGASTLSVFTICVADDGKIYAGVDALSDGNVGSSLAAWQSESDTSPTQQDPAAGGPDNVSMAFARAMDAVGSGVDTVIGGTRENDYAVNFLTTADGTTFAVTDHTPIGGGGVGFESFRIKQALSLVDASPLDVVYGTQADGGYQIAKFVKNGGIWEPAPGWASTPANITGDIADPAQASPIAYVAGHNEVLVATTNAATPATDQIYVLNGNTGAYTGVSLDLGVNIGTFGYGKIDVDAASGTGYLTSRSDTVNEPVFAKFSFNIFVPPTSADSATWGLYE